MQKQAELWQWWEEQEKTLFKRFDFDLIVEILSNAALGKYLPAVWRAGRGGVMTACWEKKKKKHFLKKRSWWTEQEIKFQDTI